MSAKQHLHLHNIRSEKRKYNNVRDEDDLVGNKQRRYCKIGNVDEPRVNTCGQKRKQEDDEKHDPLINRIKRYRLIENNFKK
jgi:hypothetical protein